MLAQLELNTLAHKKENQEKFIESKSCTCDDICDAIAIEYLKRNLKDLMKDKRAAFILEWNANSLNKFLENVPEPEVQGVPIRHFSSLALLHV